LVDGGTDLVGEEMFSLEIRKLRSALQLAATDPQPAKVLEWPEEIVWPA
jgi:hypothetical protein